jgi:hypothetical protein
MTDDLTRRGFLRASAGGAAAAAFASALPAGCARDYPQASADGVALEALTAKEYAVARAAAEALLPDVPVDPATVAQGIDRELALVGDPVRADMKSVLGLIEHLTFLSGHRRRFTALSPGQRRANLQGWSRSRFALRRGAFQAVRGFVNYFAYIQPETRSLTRFPGSWPERGVTAHVPVVDFGDIA